MKRYLIIGATSAIARACAREWLQAAAGHPTERPSFFLVGRDAKRLDQTAADLQARGARAVTTQTCEVADVATHPALLASALQALGHFDVVLIAYGSLPDQAACERNPSVALEQFAINATSVIALLTLIARHMEGQMQGTLAVITSVAGDRGRPSNYLYGSAKAAVSTFCEGLRARLFQTGVQVIDIRPGFVDTPMTEALDLPRRLVATPEQVAARIVRGVRRKRDVLYVPAFWFLIMTLIRAIPGVAFKRLKL